MQALRSLLSGGKLALVASKSLEIEPISLPAPETWFISLVPTQLQRLLALPAKRSWLANVHTILLGGAPAWETLLTQARQHNLRVAPTYGMTETAAQVATLPPEDFLQGRSGYCLLPHAQVTIRDDAGQALPAGQVGRLELVAASLMHGYWPIAQADRPTQAFLTDDLGYLDAQGRLHVLGRASDTIITGGEKVIPAEVEAALHATGLVQDVWVTAMADRHWGQVVTALVVPATPARAHVVTHLQAAIAPVLSRYKHPKHWLVLPALPRNAQGKLDRSQAQALAHAHFSNQ